MRSFSSRVDTESFLFQSKFGPRFGPFTRGPTTTRAPPSAYFVIAFVVFVSFWIVMMGVLDEVSPTRTPLSRSVYLLCMLV